MDACCYVDTVAECSDGCPRYVITLYHNSSHSYQCSYPIGLSAIHPISNALCTQEGPQGPLVTIDTYCTLQVPQWVSNAGCNAFASALEFYANQGNTLGQLALEGNIKQGFRLWSSGETTNPMVIFQGFPINMPFDIILKYSGGMFQLAWIVSDSSYTATFAYSIQSWATNIAAVRTISWNASTSSVWTLSDGSCSNSNAFPIAPYIPLAVPPYWSLAPNLMCVNLSIPAPCTSIPFATGTTVTALVYPSMSGDCPPTLNFSIITPDGFESHLAILSGPPETSTQSIYWQNQLLWTGLTFLSPLQPTTLWLAINPAGYIFVGVSNPGPYSPNIIATAGNGTLLYSCTGTSDWTVTSLQWEPLVEPCDNEFNTYVATGETITFQYKSTIVDPLSICSNDLSAIIFDIIDDSYSTSLWVALTTSTSATIYWPYPGGAYMAPVSCSWNTPLSNQSYATYQCIETPCFGIYVIIGIYNNDLENNTLTYTPLCNATIPNFYPDRFEWATVGASIVNPQVLPYPTNSPLPTTTTTSTSTSTTGRSHSPGSNSLITGIIGTVGMLVLIVVILSGAVCYRRWNDKQHNKDEHQPILPK